MSMAIIGVVAYTALTYTQIQDARDAADEQARMQAAAEERTNRNERKADEAMGKANQKRPDIVGSRENNMRAAAAGGTLLTGPGGVDEDTLPVSNTTLLGS